jgi:Na+/proline symporter
MGALSACLIALVMVVVLIVLAVLAAGIGGFEALSGLFGGADALKQHPGVYALEFAVQIVLTPVLWILGLAPVIAAYRVFTVDAAEAAKAAPAAAD